MLLLGLCCVKYYDTTYGVSLHNMYYIFYESGLYTYLVCSQFCLLQMLIYHFVLHAFNQVHSKNWSVKNESISANFSTIEVPAPGLHPECWNSTSWSATVTTLWKCCNPNTHEVLNKAYCSSSEVLIFDLNLSKCSFKSF